MSDENQDTLHLPSFEEKVLAQLGSLDSRLASLEKREEERDYDTKPIWNRVLTELSDLNTKVTDLDTKVTELDTKVTDLDTKVTELDKHMGNFDRKLDIMNKELLQVKSRSARIRNALIPHRRSIAAARIGGAEPRAGFFFDHDPFGVAQIAWLFGELVTA